MAKIIKLVQGRVKNIMVERFSGADPDGNPFGDSVETFLIDGWKVPASAEDQQIAANFGQQIVATFWYRKGDLKVGDYIRVYDLTVVTVEPQGYGMTKAQLKGTAT